MCTESWSILTNCTGFVNSIQSWYINSKVYWLVYCRLKAVWTWNLKKPICINPKKKEEKMSEGFFRVKWCLKNVEPVLQWPSWSFKANGHVLQPMFVFTIRFIQTFYTKVRPFLCIHLLPNTTRNSEMPSEKWKQIAEWRTLRWNLCATSPLPFAVETLNIYNGKLKQMSI